MLEIFRICFAAGVTLTAQEYQKAIKLCKYSISALQYEDPSTAVDNLAKALKLLTTGQEWYMFPCVLHIWSSLSKLTLINYTHNVLQKIICFHPICDCWLILFRCSSFHGARSVATICYLTAGPRQNRLWTIRIKAAFLTYSFVAVMLHYQVSHRWTNLETFSVSFSHLFYIINETHPNDLRSMAKYSVIEIRISKRCL